MRPSALKRLCLSLVAIAISASAALADVKIKTRSSTEGQSSESTVYIKGARQRTEQAGSNNVEILQCDRRRSLSLDTGKKTYSVTPLSADAGAAPQAAARPSAPADDDDSRRGGVVTYTTVTTDLNETRKFPELGGIVARHYRSEMTVSSSPDACMPMNMKIVRDGWYADFDAEFTCDLGWRGNIPRMPGAEGCRDRYEMKNTGPAIRGYPVRETLTMTFTMSMQGQSFSRTTTTTTEVVELSNTPLDPSLFDVPAGYREVKGEDSDEADGDAASHDMGGRQSGESRPRITQADSMPAQSNSAPAQAQAVNDDSAASSDAGAKSEGIVRVGVILPRATSAEHVDRMSLALAVREALLAALPGPSFEAVALDAQTPEQAASEARAKGCDFLLFTNVTHKKGGGGGFGGFMKKAAPVVDAVPVVGGTTGAVATSVGRAVVHTAADVSSSVKEKDELTFEYRLATVSAPSSPVAAKTIKAKARADGEDILTPLAGQEAEAVRAAAGK